MNAEDLRELAERATGVEGRPATRLAEVHSRIRAARRRRQAGVVAATVVAVVLALTAGSAIVKLTDADPPPVTPPSPSPKPKVDEHKNATGERQLVWASGSTIHVGDKTIDVGGEVAGVAATDDGAVFTRYRDERGHSCSITYKCGVLWFTDGSDKLLLGHAFGSPVRGWFIDVSSAGSTVVWFEPAGRPRDAVHREPGEYVVYDTAARAEVARFGSGGSDIEAVFDDYVYWIPDAKDKEWCPDYSEYYAACRRYRAVMRLDIRTGTQTKVPWSAYDSDRRSRPRMFVYRASGGSEPPGLRYVDELDFGHQGDRIAADDFDAGVVSPRLARTGEPVRLRLPAGYPDPGGREGFQFVMWLDDARIALAADFTDDFLSCRLPDGRCRVIASGPMEYGFRGRG